MMREGMKQRLHFVQKCRIEQPTWVVFEWHKRPGAFERLLPPWIKVNVIHKEGIGIQEGVRITAEIKIKGWASRQTLLHCDYIEGEQFCNCLIEGPLPYWKHTHRFGPLGPHASEMEDSIEYELPHAKMLLSGWWDNFMNYELRRLFNYRHTILRHDLQAHQGVSPMKILVTGSSGLIGSELIHFLTTGGHEVKKLVRKVHHKESAEISWDPQHQLIDKEGLEGLDVVIHLAGENIGNGRWTEEKKKQILNSRVEGTKLLANALASLKNPPKVFICASAVGFYGDRGEEVLDEKSAKGSGFLSDVCEQWERATQPAAEKGIRVVNLRFGMVLSPKGGGLKQMLSAFQWGLGGRIGSGEQYVSWISIDDVLGIIAFVLHRESLSGPINAVSQHPVKNRDFTRILGHVLHRPTFMAIPAFLARRLFGQMADEVLLSSVRAEPRVLMKEGFHFSTPTLERALRHLLGKTV